MRGIVIQACLGRHDCTSAQNDTTHKPADLGVRREGILQIGDPVAGRGLGSGTAR